MPKRKIPPKDMVVSIMKEVMQRRRVVTTLNELWTLVMTNLKKINRRFAISPQRVKKMAVQTPEIEIKAKTRRSKTKVTSCPVCKNGLGKIYGKNLLGKKMHSGYRCKNCGYRTGVKVTVPMKYIFIRKPS